MKIKVFDKVLSSCTFHFGVLKNEYVLDRLNFKPRILCDIYKWGHMNYDMVWNSILKY